MSLKNVTKATISLWYAMSGLKSNDTANVICVPRLTNNASISVAIVNIPFLSRVSTLHS